MPGDFCPCPCCQKRREARRRWYQEHAAEVIKVNNEYRDAWRKKKRAEPSDADLDAKALQTMPWRKQA